MDAVMNTIQRLGGRVNLELGTLTVSSRVQVSFVLELPLACFEYFDPQAGALPLAQTAA